MKIRSSDSFSRRVERLVASGIPERTAIHSIKEVEYDMKRNPRKYLQPFIKAPNGTVIKNQEFHDLYGDPDRPWENVGSGDWKEKLQHDIQEADQKRFNEGKYKSFY